MFRSAPASRDVHSTPALYFPMGSHGLAMAAMPTAHAPRGHGWTRDAAAAVRSLPDALRCGYTSKRCENPRTVKKSGGLHRFCAYHRERANKNQWRVDNRRRQLRKMGQSASKSASDAGSPRSTTSDTIDEAELCEDDHLDSGKGEDDSGENSMISLTDPAGSPNTLSDQDAKILNAMLFSDEDEPSSVDAVAVPLVGNEIVGEKRTLESLEPPCEASVSMDASWNCICSQCLAWSTVLFYSDALEAARSARVQKYARV